ncbi:MAG: transcriptional repressor LexA [Candidatus Dojkabacteria bacterium]
MDINLTKKQSKVLRVIRDFYLENGSAPSLTELQRMLHISTKRGVVSHLEALERKGFIIRTSEPRGIHIVNETEEDLLYEYLVGIPILGYANGGDPLVLAEEENIGILQLEKSLVKNRGNLFSLIVKGDSMNMREVNGKNIEDGQYVIIQKDAEIEDGDVVLAIIDGCATVKNIKREKNMTILYPKSSNPVHKPIYLDVNSDSLINGKVVMVLDNPN